MGHVDHQQRAHLVGDLTHALVVPLARIGRSAAHDQFRMALHGQLLHGIVVDAARSLVQPIADGLEVLARHVDRRTVRKVASVCEVQPHEGVARLHAGEEDRHVGLGTRVRLDVGPLRTVEFAKTLDGQRLHFVNHLATSVVTCSGVTFGILVREHRAHGLHHLIADEVLRGDQLDAVHLTAPLFGNQIENPGISFHVLLSRVIE